MSNPSLESRITPIINVHPDEKYSLENRKWQGIPGVELSKSGLLWATWYSGGDGEMQDNYILLTASNDDGNTWSKPLYVVDPPNSVRAFDPCLWIDPYGRLWWFWSQSYSVKRDDIPDEEHFIADENCCVWGAFTENPDSMNCVWSKPMYIANGVMMNKPTVLSSGEWLLPTAIWHSIKVTNSEYIEQQKSNVTVSNDSGLTFAFKGGAEVQNRGYDEHMVVELEDGKLWMLIRGKHDLENNGICQSYSTDKGETWTQGEYSSLDGPGSRFFIRRLQSGRLLLINHKTIIKEYKGKLAKMRSHLCAWLSYDEGKNWIGELLLDERENVSYPDGVESKDGSIYIIHDRDRYGEKEIVLSKITEQDIIEGQIVSNHSFLKKTINA